MNSIYGRAHYLWLALIALACVGGLAFDPTPNRPEVHRAGYRLLEADLHAHTTFSDGSLTPIGLARQAERRGLDVLGLTEHNTAVPSKIARAYSKMVGGPYILVGEEITTARFHIISFGLKDTVNTHHEPHDVIAEIHAQGGIAIAAHPVRGFWPSLIPVRDEFDGTEVMHPIAFRGGSPQWRWADMVQYYEGSKDPETGQPKLMAIGSSDYHWGSVLGLCRTLVFVEEPVSEESILAAFHAHRTVVIDADGKHYGDAKMIAALEKDPYVPRTSDFIYKGEGTADRILRALGWFGIVGIVLFGRMHKRGALRKPAPRHQEQDGDPSYSSAST